MLTPAIDAANERLVKDGIASIEPVTFHSLRRTYASLRCAAGDDVRYTAAQIVTRIRASRCERMRRPRNGASGSQGLTCGPTIARSNGHEWALSRPKSRSRFQRRQQKAPSSGASGERMMGFEPTTFCMARNPRETPAGVTRRRTAWLSEAASDERDRRCLQTTAKADSKADWADARSGLQRSTGDVRMMH